MVTALHIQNRWVVFILFLICAIGVVIGIQHYKQTYTVDLSNLEINHLSLNQQFNREGYETNKNIRLDRFKFYNDKKYQNLIVKVRAKNNLVKGIVLTKHDEVKTNFGATINGSINSLINYLGPDYKRLHIGKQYEAIKYVDHEHRMKLVVLYKDDKIKRMEFFSR